VLSTLSGVLRLLARLVLAAALLLAGFLVATLLMLWIVGVLRHGLSPFAPCPAPMNLAIECDRAAAVMWKAHHPQRV
jgi:hypothetical protein